MEGLPASPADEQTLLMVFSFASRVAAGLISYDNRVRSRNHKTRELPGSLMSGPIQPSVAVHSFLQLNAALHQTHAHNVAPILYNSNNEQHPSNVRPSLARTTQSCE
jgi:hypothetical protein